jgi:hypothetical protein
MEMFNAMSLFGLIEIIMEIQTLVWIFIIGSDQKSPPNKQENNCS